MLENLGNRDAFISIIIQDLNGEEIPAENVVVQPANLLITKGGKDVKKIDVRMFAQVSNHNSIASSRASSSMSDASTCAPPVAFRILVLWGEERQRQRLKMLERYKRDKFSFLRRYFTVSKYSGEPTVVGDETDELLSMEDYNMFKAYLRLSTIEVLDNRYPRTRPSSVLGNQSMSVAPSGTAVLRIDPDSTLKVDDTLTNH